MATKKHFGYTGSIQKDTNRLIASSQANWGALEEGSFIIFEDDQDFYKVINKENYFYIKDFDKVEQDKIFIHENVGIKLSLNDSIKLTFKEYELSSINIKNPGHGFNVGDILTIQGGEIKKDLIEDANIPSEIRVQEVGDDGEILEVEIISNSLYLSPPEETLQEFKSCALDLNFSMSDKRTIETRSISNLLYSEEGTVIVLNHPLPPNSKHGKISSFRCVESKLKFELVIILALTQPALFVNQSGISKFVELSKYFSPLTFLTCFKNNSSEKLPFFHISANCLEVY